MRSERITLRHWQETDAKALYRYASDPEVGLRAGWAPHQSETESLEIIRTVFNNPTTWAIVWKKTGEAIGAIGYGPSCDCSLPARDGEPTVGYWVGKPFWGKGICTEALVIMISHIRKTTEIPSGSSHPILLPLSLEGCYRRSEWLCVPHISRSQGRNKQSIVS